MTEAQHQRYRVLRRLATGGMAEVFLAESASIEGFRKMVAIKRVLPELSEKKRFIAMFLDEARLSASLNHSNVAQVFDIGVGDRAYFIVMEYVDGADLKAIVEAMRSRGELVPVEVACFIATKICEGLAYAHELRGSDGAPLEIVHRDVSPPNVLLTKYGEVKLVDFGLAKARSQLEKSEAGVVKGKFGYLSPEAASGGVVDKRTDVFAVGILLWEMLAGRRLFLGDTDFDTVHLVRAAAIPELRALNPKVPAELEATLKRALARDPAQRYGTARELGRDLNAFLFRYGHPVSAFELAEHVRAAMAMRTQEAPRTSSIIDRLIEEALLEFTSLQDAPVPSAPAVSEPRRPSGYEDVSSWIDELDIAVAQRASRPPSSSRMSMPPRASAAPASVTSATHTPRPIGVVDIRQGTSMAPEAGRISIPSPPLMPAMFSASTGASPPAGGPPSIPVPLTGALARTPALTADTTPKTTPAPTLTAPLVVGAAHSKRSTLIAIAAIVVIALIALLGTLLRR